MSSINDFDRHYLWHPFSQEKLEDSPLAVVRGEGATLYDEAGNSYLDLISSWWVNLHGHGHPYIAHAIYEQAKTLEHVLFAGFTHPPAVRLVQKLITLLPSSLQRFFFSDNGSTAVEVALKMAYQYWLNHGESKRQIFLSFEEGYHGDTFGAMSVGSSSYHHPFKDLFFKRATIPFPATWEQDDRIEEKEAAALEKLEEFLTKHSRETVAFIAEPLVQGASGMRMCRAPFLKKVCDKLRAAGILVIFDEIMTGFCRTGTFFAFEQVDITPDFICLSKGLTGGFLPLALTVTSEKIYRAFWGEDMQKAFLHGHSYTANPLGCAAACASLELLCQEETQKQIQHINAVHKYCLPEVTASRIGGSKLRILGTIAAFDLPYSLTLQQVKHLRSCFLKEGLLLRPLGNVVYLLPPYCISQEELERAYQKIKQLLITEFF